MSVDLKRRSHRVSGFLCRTRWTGDAIVTKRIAGPAIVESSFTTIVLNPGARAERTASGSLAIEPGTLAPAGAQTSTIKAAN